MTKKHYYEEIVPSSKELKKSGKQQTIPFVQKDMDMIHSERVTNDVIVVANDGREIRKKTGMVANRIKDRSYMIVQQRTVSTFDRNALADKFRKDVLVDMKNKGIQNIEKDTVDYAIEGKIREYIKTNINNEFPITKDEFLEMAQVGSNNLSYVMDKIIIPYMQNTPNDIEKVIEHSVDENYNKVEKVIAIPTMPKIGIAKYEDTNKEDHYFIRVDKDLLARLVGINKNAPYATIYLATKEKLDSKYTATLYELLSRCVSMMNKFDKRTGRVSFEYKELLKYFGSDLGKKKKRNPKYNKETMSSDKEFVKQNGRHIWEVDNNGTVIYEKEYKKTYNDFKKDILNVAIAEYNNKSGQTVAIEEIKRTKLGKISKIGAIEEIIFIVSDSRPIKTNDFIASLYYFKANPSNLTFKEIKNALTILVSDNNEIEEESLNRERIIGDLKTTEELIEYDLNENNKAFNDLKIILNSKNENFKDYYYDDVLNTVFLKKQKEKAMRIGDNCIESLESLENLHGDLVEALLSEKQNNLPIDYVPFSITFDNKAITVNKTNFNTHKNKVDFLIKEKNHKAFKGFKSRFIKKDFYEAFFDL